jgi:hypothetical protein
MKITLATIGLLAGAACPALGATLVACPAGAPAKGCTFKGDGAIQAAIDKAVDGDTILVRAGVYAPRAYRDLPYKEIIVRAFVAVDGKRLTIQGEKGAVLDGSAGLPSTAIGLRNADVTISGLDITGFRFDIEEDDIYEGHGIFAVDSRARISGVTISRYQKMGLTGRGNTILDARDLRVLDGHVATWLYEGAYLRLDGAVFRNNDSSAVAAYNDSVAHLMRIAVDRSTDDGLYAEDNAAIYVSDSLIVGSKPIALNATGKSRIVGRNLALHGNAADTSETGVALEGVIAGDPRVDADYRPLAGSPIEGKGIGPAASH